MTEAAKGHFFNDANGEKWVFTVNVFTLSRVKKETGIDLARAIEPNNTTLTEIWSDPVMFFDVVIALLGSEIERRGMSLEEFGEGLNNEEIVQEATAALIRAVIDFFPREKAVAIRRAFDQVWSITAEKMRLQTEQTVKNLEGIDYEKLVEDSQALLSGNPTGDTSTPTVIPQTSGA